MDEKLKDWKTIISDVVYTHLANLGLGGVTVSEWRGEKNVLLSKVLNGYCDPLVKDLEKELEPFINDILEKNRKMYNKVQFWRALGECQDQM